MNFFDIKKWIAGLGIVSFWFWFKAKFSTHDEHNMLNGLVFSLYEQFPLFLIGCVCLTLFLLLRKIKY